jgi:hypothetical protein
MAGSAIEALIEDLLVVEVESELIFNHFEIFAKISVFQELLIDLLLLEEVDSAGASGSDAVGGSFAEKVLIVAEECVRRLDRTKSTSTFVIKCRVWPKIFVSYTYPWCR